MLTGKEQKLLDALEPRALEEGIEIVTLEIVGARIEKPTTVTEAVLEPTEIAPKPTKTVPEPTEITPQSTATVLEPTETVPAEPASAEPQPAPEAEPPALPEWRILGEVFGTYILVECEGELVFVDKHAAHERIIFDRLVAAGEKPLVQYLISPLVLSFTREEASVLLENLETVAGLGFEIGHFGGESFAVRALPGEIERDDAQAVLEQIAEDLRSHRRVDMLDRREELLRLIACKAAIKANSKTSDAERRVLVERVMGYRDVRFCPHGRPVAAVLDRAELERRINRRV